MRSDTALLAALALLTTTLAAPTLLRRDDAPIKVTAEQLIQICPTSASCSPSQPECAPASRAATFISNSFATYHITSPGVAAALIATMAQESGEFKYAHNISPGRPGQGTRNMQMPNLNAEYLASIPELKGQAEAVKGDAGKVLTLLMKYGDYDFGSAAWFLVTKCKDTVKGLESGKQEGWDNYVTCVGASPGDGRLEYWKKAVKALSVDRS